MLSHVASSLDSSSTIVPKRQPPQEQASQEEAQNSAESALTRQKAALYHILQEGQPDQVMYALWDPQYREVVATLPDSVFVSAFVLLRPEHFVEPYLHLYHSLHPVTVLIKGYKTLEDTFESFCKALKEIANLRKSARPLGLAEYTHLLHCASAMGDEAMGDQIWQEMTDENVVPDLQCYNYYLESKIWDGARTGMERHRLRVSPFYYRKRRFHHPPRGYQGYGTAGRSVRKATLTLFREMTDSGIDGDESSFVNMFLASARVGHTLGMKAILKTAWNLDIEQLLTNPDEHAPLTSYDRSSPLYPSSRLLLALAHGFGTNSDISAALRSVDFVSQQYKIKIPSQVWLELFDRAYVLSKSRFGPDRQRDAKGKVPREILSGIFEMMTSEPFHVKPTIVVYRMLARTAYDMDRLRDFTSRLDAAYNLLRETRRRRKETRLILEQYLGAPFATDLSSRPSGLTVERALQSSSFWNALHRYKLLRYQVNQQTTLIEKMARLIFINNRWVGRNHTKKWIRQMIPKLLGEWRDFIPLSLYFSIPGPNGGRLEFQGETSRNSENIRPHIYAPVRRLPDGETVAPGEVLEIDDDYVWNGVRKHFGDYVHQSPLNEIFSSKPMELAEEVDEMSHSYSHSISMIPLT